MGVVYEAADTALRRRAAIKVLRPELFTAAFAARFVTEARALAAVRHPHIVTIYDAQAKDGLSLLIMEFVEGPTLQPRGKIQQLVLADPGVEEAIQRRSVERDVPIEVARADAQEMFVEIAAHMSSTFLAILNFFVSAIIRRLFASVEVSGIELTGEVAFRSDRLSNPDRLFFDFPNSVAAIALAAQARGIQTPIIKAIRVGSPTRGVTRVVLELQGSPRYSAFPLYSPFRLVIDLEAGQTSSPPPAGPAPAPAAAVAAPTPAVAVPTPTPTPAPSGPPPRTALSSGDRARPGSRAPRT